MLKTLAPLLYVSAVGALVAGGCTAPAETARRTAQQAPAVDEIQYGLSASTERFGAEVLFGEWVAQIVRRAPREKQGPPWQFDGGVYLDAHTTELRPKMHLTLAEDGSYSLITNYSGQTNDRAIVFGVWTLGSGKVTLTQDGQETWVFTYRGGKLLTEKEDGTQIVLGRR